MKYKSGEYTLIKFDRFGSKKATKSYGSYLKAKIKLDKYLKRNNGCSGVITRVIYNSSLEEDKWSYKNNDV